MRRRSTTSSEGTSVNKRQLIEMLEDSLPDNVEITVQYRDSWYVSTQPYQLREGIETLNYAELRLIVFRHADNLGVTMSELTEEVLREGEEKC